MGSSKRKNNQAKSKDSIVLTKETLGVVLVLFSTLVLICLISGDGIFSAPGQYVKAFFLGLFGYFAYVVVTSLICVGVMLVADKKLPLSKRVKFLLTFALVLIMLLAQVITMSGSSLSYGEYLKESYAMGWGGLKESSGGGVLTALVAYPITLLLTEIGAYVVLGVLIAIDVYALVLTYVKPPKQKAEKTNKKFNSSYVEEKAVSEANTEELVVEKAFPVQTLSKPTEKPMQRLFVNNPQDFAVKSNRELKKGESAELKLGFANGGLNVSSAEQPYSKTFSEDLKKKIDYIKMPSVIDVEKTIATDYSTKPKSIMRDEQTTTSSVSVSDYVPSRQTKEQTPQVQPEQSIPMFEHEGETVGDNAQSRANSFSNKYADIEDIVGSAKPTPSITEEFRPIESYAQNSVESNVQPRIEREIPVVEEKIEQEIVAPKEEINDTPPPESNIIKRSRGIFFGEEKTETAKEEPAVLSPSEKPSFTSRVTADGNVGGRSRGFDFNSVQNQSKEETPEKKEKPAPPINRPYHRPPIDLLQTYAQTVDQSEENHEQKLEIIKRTLGDFNINAEPQGYIQGPSITRYEIMMPAGVSVRKVLGFDDDLKMRLESKSGVRIEAPIPGKNLVGIEVANKHKVTVGLRQVIEGMAGKKIKSGALEFAIGKDIVGNSISDDLAKGPHYLVAGATGSGKSVCLNAMIVSLIMRYSPEDLRLILIDPKRVGFRCYEHLPHLMIDEIITEPKKALAVLQWAYNEMEKRYAIFENSSGVISNIQAYNEEIASATVPKMPRIVIIVDELADLMETCKKDMESKIRALAQKSRAAGIHLVLATQRPSVDIITGTIKANLPSRIALKVMNHVDSQTILSEGGAEKLLGNGDMLYKNSSMADYERYQGAWISDAEINNVVSYIIEKNKAYFDDELQEYLEKETKPKQEESYSDTDDGTGRDPNEVNEFFLKALWLAVTTQTVSISQLQRRFQIGYARAGGLVDQMERMGFVSGNEGSKARRVLLSREEFENRFGPMSDSY